MKLPNQDQPNEQQVRKAYSDIVKGYTITSFENKEVYIKHFTPIDQGLIDDHYNICFDQASNIGLPTNQEKLKILRDNKIWNQEDDFYINDTEYMIKNLHKTKAKLWKKSEIESINTQIEEEQKKLVKKLEEKDRHIGLTAEVFAQRKANEHSILFSFYKDRQCNNLLFSQEEFQELSPETLDNLVEIYNKALSIFSSRMLKLVGLSNHFQNIFSICDNSPYNFFGKALVYLTFYQSEVFSFGRYFHQILSSTENKPDEDILQDPDKLIDWYNSVQNVKSVVDNGKEGNLMIFGDNKKDLQNVGIQTSVDSPFELAKRAGKSLTAYDLAK